MQQSPSVTADTIKSHLSKKHFEQDIRLWYYDAEDPRTQLPFWQEHKVFTWLTIGNSGSQRINFIAKDFVPNTPVKTTARLISNAGNITLNTHKHGSSLNSTTFQDSIIFDYRQTVNFTSTFSSNQLLVEVTHIEFLVYQLQLLFIDLLLIGLILNIIGRIKLRMIHYLLLSLIQ